MVRRRPIRRIQPHERLPMHFAAEVGGDKEVALVETPGGEFRIQTQAHEYPLDLLAKAQITPEDIKRISSLEDAGVRGGIHSKHTWLVALHDGSLWIAKKTGAEERDEVFVYELAKRLFRAIVPETTVANLPRIGWVSVQRKVAGVPAGRVDGLHGYFHGNDEMLADLAAMLVLDYLIGNPDRHSNNWFLMHNDRLAAIDNGWAGEDLTMSFADVFQPARLAGMMEDERLWPQLLKGIAALIQDLEGRGDEVRALAEEIGIDKKEAVEMVRLWEPKLASMAKLIRSEAGRVEKGRTYLEPGERSPKGTQEQVGPRGGRYYEEFASGEEAGGRTQEEEHARVMDWLERHEVPQDEEGRYRFYHATPKDALEGIRREGLKEGSLLETDPEDAAHFAARDRELSREQVVVLPIAVRPHEIRVGQWAALRKPYMIDESVEKARVYIEPGQQPPLGTQVEEGPRGGLYYETEGHGATKADYTVWDSVAYYGADSELDLTDEAYYGRQEAFLAAVKPAQIAQSAHKYDLIAYKRRAYIAVNKFLRGQRRGLDQDDRRLVDSIDEALQESPGLAQSVTVYRGIGRKVLKTLRVGDRFKDNGFVSTSIGQRFAETWAGAMMVIQVPTGAKGLWMEQPYVPDPQYSGVRTEQELLFPRGREFEVVEKEQRDGKPTVVVRMVA